MPTQALSRSFGLDDPLDAGAPALLEQAHLRRGGGLGGPARLLDGLDLVPGAGQVGLEVAQDGLKLGVGDEPGVLAVALEQRQVGQARRQERRRRVGGAQRRAPGGRVGRVCGRVEGLVARQVDAGAGVLGRARGQAGVLAGYERRERGLIRGRDGWVELVGGGGGVELRGDEGGGGAAVGVGERDVDVCVPGRLADGGMVWVECGAWVVRPLG